jgi:dynein heavy chain 1, cytosolic
MTVQITKVIGTRLFSRDFTTFEATVNSCEAIFATWDEQIREFINVAREMTRKRSVKRVNPRNASFLSKSYPHTRSYRKESSMCMNLERTTSN